MPRGPHPRGGRPRTEPVLDHVIRASVDGANGVHHPETGHYKEVVLGGMRSADHAREIRRALYRSARYMKYSLKCNVEKDGAGGYQLRFTVIDKEIARQYINALPPEKRAYDPRGWSE